VYCKGFSQSQVISSDLYERKKITLKTD